MILQRATLIVPYYRNPGMLRLQLLHWAEMGLGWKIILVDDGSPEPALGVWEGSPARKSLKDQVSIYRIGIDIPWNRGGARNLGAHVADTDWIVQVDIDHILHEPQKLLRQNVDPRHWYRFPRWRMGTADETRKKDKIPPDCSFGEIHPHVDSYLITKALYWDVGGYNEDYSGCLGGGGAFLKQLERRAGPSGMVSCGSALHVYTRSVVKDSSDWALSRDPKEYTRRKKHVASEMQRPSNPLRFPWERVL